MTTIRAEASAFETIDQNSFSTLNENVKSSEAVEYSRKCIWQLFLNSLSYDSIDSIDSRNRSRAKIDNYNIISLDSLCASSSVVYQLTLDIFVSTGS